MIAAILRLFALRPLLTMAILGPDGVGRARVQRRDAAPEKMLAGTAAVSRDRGGCLTLRANGDQGVCRSAARARSTRSMASSPVVPTADRCPILRPGRAEALP